jgi:DNA-binding ferritin-like protein
MTEHEQMQAQIEAIDQRLGDMAEALEPNKAAASRVGAELAGQQQLISDINQGMDNAQGHVSKAIEQEKDVQEMSKGNWVGWILAILFLIAIIVAAIL